MKDTRISSSFLYIFTVSRETLCYLCHVMFHVKHFVFSFLTLYQEHHISNSTCKNHLQYEIIFFVYQLELWTIFYLPIYDN